MNNSSSKSIPISTINFKSTNKSREGKAALIGGGPPGYLLGKSGAGKGKFDMDFIMEKDEELVT